MAQVINLDSGAYVQDALGRRVIDLDFALAQVRADAEKIYVKDPRVKGGGYYRTVKGGSGKGAKNKNPKITKKGLLVGAGLAAVTGAALKAEPSLQRLFAKQKTAKTSSTTDQPSEQSSTKASQESQGSDDKIAKAEETMSDIKATNAKSKDMLDKTQAKIEERKRKKAEPAREITSIEDLDEYMGFGKNSK